MAAKPMSNIFKLCHKLSSHKTQQTELSMAKTWQRVYRNTQSDEGLNYLLKLRKRALSNDSSLLSNTAKYDLEGYDFLAPVTIMLMGPPNAGKSTFFNYLVGEQRALISEIAGTTRDTITATLQFGGHEVLLMDTAGLREEPSQKVSRLLMIASKPKARNWSKT